MNLNRAVDFDSHVGGAGGGQEPRNVRGAGQKGKWKPEDRPAFEYLDCWGGKGVVFFDLFCLKRREKQVEMSP